MWRLVAGEGEGAKRKKVIVYEGEAPQGLSRREIFTDARVFPRLRTVRIDRNRISGAVGKPRERGFKRMRDKNGI